MIFIPESLVDLQKKAEKCLCTRKIGWSQKQKKVSATRLDLYLSLTNFFLEEQLTSMGRQMPLFSYNVKKNTAEIEIYNNFSS